MFDLVGLQVTRRGALDEANAKRQRGWLGEEEVEEGEAALCGAAPLPHEDAEVVASHVPPRTGSSDKHARRQPRQHEEEEEDLGGQGMSKQQQEGGGGEEAGAAADDDNNEPPADEGEAPKIKALARTALLQPILEAWHGPAAMVGGGGSGGGQEAQEQGEVALAAATVGGAFDELRGSVAGGDSSTAAARDRALALARRTHDRMQQLRQALEQQAMRLPGGVLKAVPEQGEDEDGQQHQQQYAAADVYGLRADD